MKFRIGDRVKLIKEVATPAALAMLKNLDLTVTEVNSNVIKVNGIEWYFIASQFKLADTPQTLIKNNCLLKINDNIYLYANGEISNGTFITYFPVDKVTRDFELNGLVIEGITNPINSIELILYKLDKIYGYSEKIWERPKESVELSIKDIAKKFNVDPKQIRIKED